MPEKVESAYRLLPGYYRLLYQLAAQRMNRALMTEDEEAATRLIEAAQQNAVDGLDAAGSVLSSFDARRYRRPWRIRRPRPLTASELALDQFLRRTVRPSLRVLLAGILQAQGEEGEAERLVTDVRTRASADEIAFRVYYDLACYEAGKTAAVQADIEPHQQALSDLQVALSKAPGKRRTELAWWARRDPSLEPLRESPSAGGGFRRLLERYDTAGSTSAPAPSSSSPQTASSLMEALRSFVRERSDEPAGESRPEEDERPESGEGVPSGD
jgi:hypothetical protein